MVYEVYTSLVARSKTQLLSLSVMPGGALQLWSREVAARSWEKLGEIGLWTSVGRGEGRGKFMRCEVGIVELNGICERGNLLSSTMKDWCKQGI
jgi:Origin recognition complex (ORC) subunit 4 C-terminus